MLNNLEAERARHNMTREALASHLQVSAKTYYNWVQENTDIPSSKLKELAKLFGVSVDYLIGIKTETAV